MPFLSMADAYLHGGYSDLEAGVIKLLDEINPIAEHAIWRAVDGGAYTYRQEESLPNVIWRGANQPGSPSYGTINPRTERLMNLDGEVQIDLALIQLQGRGQKAVDLKTEQYDLMVQSASNAISQGFFEGDDVADINSIVGLRQRLTGNQVVNAAGTTGGTALTLAMLDQLISRVPFPANGKKVLYMNRNLSLQVTALLRAAGVSVVYNVSEPGKIGMQVDNYGGCPIKLVETTGTGATILDFDETVGTNATTASIYCVAWGMNAVQMLYGGGSKLLTVNDMGIMQTKRAVMGYLSMYPGVAIKHGRAGARLRGLTAA